MWLISFNMIPSFIIFPVNDTILFIFVAGKNIIVDIVHRTRGKKVLKFIGKCKTPCVSKAMLSRKNPAGSYQNYLTSNCTTELYWQKNNVVQRKTDM